MSAPSAATATGILLAVAEAIRALGEVPSGHLYARLMAHMSLEGFESIIGILVRSGVVEQRSHLLIWKGAGK